MRYIDSFNGYLTVDAPGFVWCGKFIDVLLKHISALREQNPLEDVEVFDNFSGKLLGVNTFSISYLLTDTENLKVGNFQITSNNYHGTSWVFCLCFNNHNNYNTYTVLKSILINSVV